MKLSNLKARDIVGRAGEKKISRASIAQGLEHWSCKPGVESSNLSGGKSFLRLPLVFSSLLSNILLNESSRFKKNPARLNFILLLFHSFFSLWSSSVSEASITEVCRIKRALNQQLNNSIIAIFKFNLNYGLSNSTEENGGSIKKLSFFSLPSRLLFRSRTMAALLQPVDLTVTFCRRSRYVRTVSW